MPKKNSLKNQVLEQVKNNSLEFFISPGVKRFKKLFFRPLEYFYLAKYPEYLLSAASKHKHNPDFMGKIILVIINSPYLFSYIDFIDDYIQKNGYQFLDEKDFSRYIEYKIVQYVIFSDKYPELASKLTKQYSIPR